MPKHFIPNYCELVSANPKSRPNPKQFKESCTNPGGFMDNDFVKAMVFLEEIQVRIWLVYAKENSIQGATLMLAWWPGASKIFVRARKHLWCGM